MATKPTVPAPATVSLSDIKPAAVRLAPVKPTTAKPATLKPATAKPTQSATPITTSPAPQTVVAGTPPAENTPEPDKKNTPEQTTPPINSPEKKDTPAPVVPAVATAPATVKPKPTTSTPRPLTKTAANPTAKPASRRKNTTERHPETDLLCPRCMGKLNVEGDRLPELCPICGFILRAKRQKAANHNFELAFRKARVLRGRATRREFWGFSIIMGGLAVLLAAAMDYVCNGAAVSLLREYANIPALPGMAQYILAAMLGAAILIWVVALPLPLLTLTIRRLHDVGRSMLWPTAVILCGLAAAAAMNINDIILRVLGSVPDHLIHLNKWGGYAAMGLGVLAIILMLVILMFCLMDSQRGTNKYGPSTKYPLE